VKGIQGIPHKQKGLIEFPEPGPTFFEFQAYMREGRKRENL
jgi:hypothetical protein